MKKLFTKVVRAIAALVVVFAISIGTVSPASAAATLGVGFNDITAGAVPGSAVVTAYSYNDEPVDFDVRLDGVKIATFTTAPGGTPDLSVSNSMTYSNLSSGSVLTVVFVMFSDLVMATYDVPGMPSRVVTPAAPTSDGQTVTIPTTDGSHVYKDAATEEILQSGPRPLAPGSTLTVIAAPALPNVTLTTTGPWSFSYIPPTNPEPEKEVASHPKPVTFIDKCGTADDTIDYPPLVKGFEKYVTGDQPGGVVVVLAALKGGFEAPDGAVVSWTFTFTDVPCVTELKPVEVNPVVPHVNQPEVKTPVVTQPKTVEQLAQTTTTQTDRNYTVRGAASGASTASLSAWPPIAAGTLVLVAIVAVVRRRSVTGVSE